MVAFAASGFMFLALVAGAIAWFGPARLGRSTSEARILGLRRHGPDGQDDESAGPTLKRSHSSIPTLQRMLSGNWAASAERDLQQANVQLRVGEYLLVRLVLAGFAFFLAILVTRMHPLGILLGLALGAGGYLVPPLYLGLLRRRRLAKIEKQLVDFLPMLASSLRSGFAFQQGVELAADQLEAPLADELTILLSDTNLGATIDNALLDMERRVGSTDLDMMVTAVLVQRGSGGNLSEILEGAVHTLRERARIRGDIQTLTASQRLTGLILSIYPVAIGLLLLAIMPSLWSVMFTETAGQIFLGVAVGLQLLGFLIMQRVMKVEI